MSGELVVMCGLPRSGKSTLVREKYIPEGYAVVCPDNVRFALHGYRYIKQAEPTVWAMVYVMIDSLIMSGCKVVVDGCFYREIDRKALRERGAEFVLVPTSREQCIHRAILLNDQEIIPIIEKMADGFEPLELPSCPDCGADMVRFGAGAYRCNNCGATSGCL